MKLFATSAPDWQALIMIIITMMKMKKGTIIRSTPNRQNISKNGSNGQNCNFATPCLVLLFNLEIGLITFARKEVVMKLKKKPSRVCSANSRGKLVSSQCINAL